MPRTSTLKAGAAALGLLIGFATAPESQVALDRDVTPYTVAVAWREGGGTPELPAVAGVQTDDWGGRLAPVPRAKRAEPASAPPAARAKPAPRAEAVARAEAAPEEAPSPLPAPPVSAIATALAAPRPLCPNEARGIHEARAVRHHREVLGHAEELTG
ncbi:MAG TPA: hypothetical protein VM759_12245 [Longimicrobium sp.]|nr:hypothetical protein [Longimicrobium sp.]